MGNDESIQKTKMITLIEKRGKKKHTSKPLMLLGAFVFIFGTIAESTALASCMAARTNSAERMLQE